MHYDASILQSYYTVFYRFADVVVPRSKTRQMFTSTYIRCYINDDGIVEKKRPLNDIRTREETAASLKSAEKRNGGGEKENPKDTKYIYKKLLARAELDHFHKYQHTRALLFAQTSHILLLSSRTHAVDCVLFTRFGLKSNRTTGNTDCSVPDKIVFSEEGEKMFEK